MDINISEIEMFPNMSVQNTLTLIALSERNGSLIKCSAHFSDPPAKFSPEFVMLIQGVLYSLIIIIELWILLPLVITIMKDH